MGCHDLIQRGALWPHDPISYVLHHRVHNAAKLKLNLGSLGQPQNLALGEQEAVRTALLVADKGIEGRGREMLRVFASVEQGNELRGVQPVAVMPLGRDGHVKGTRIRVDLAGLNHTRELAHG